MHADQYFHLDRDDGQQAADIAAYELYFLDQAKKAHALLSCAAAQAGARILAEDLAFLVQCHATVEGRLTLAGALAESIAERLVCQELKGGESVLRQPVTEDGHRAIKLALGHACREFESFLATEAAR